jgi:hypothetical protein
VKIIIKKGGSDKFKEPSAVANFLSEHYSLHYPEQPSAVGGVSKFKRFYLEAGVTRRTARLCYNKVEKKLTENDLTLGLVKKIFVLAIESSS